MPGWRTRGAGTGLLKELGAVGGMGGRGQGGPKHQSPSNKPDAVV